MYEYERAYQKLKEEAISKVDFLGYRIEETRFMGSCRVRIILNKDRYLEFGSWSELKYFIDKMEVA